MPFTLTMPKLSPTMESGVIAKWHKKEGDFVEAGELLLEVATDKATVEHSALDEGYLRKIVAAEGSEVEVNHPIAIFTAKKDEKIEGYQAETVITDTTEKKEVEEEKTAVAKETPKAEKATPSLHQPLFQPEPPLEKYTFDRPIGPAPERLIASPLARRLAKEKGLDLAAVKGSGPGQRIMSRDLEKAPQTGAIAFGHREAPKEQPGSYEEVTLSPMRKAISKRLQESKSFIPHFYVQQTVNAEALVQAHAQLKELGIKVTYNDLAIRACALALKGHPVINSGYNSVNQTVIQFKTIDISIAVSVEGGLITPIIRHADYKNVVEISTEVKALARRAKEGKLEEHEYKGGSFTVSNLGMFGVTDFQGIINPPQAALIAISGIKDAPVVKESKIVPGKQMNITLSADHRVIDGVAAAEFVNTVMYFLENPLSLVL